MLAVFSCYQQTIRNDKITVLDLVKHTQSVVNNLKSLNSIILIGGWVDVPICHEKEETLANILQKRIDIDKYFVRTFKPIANLDSNANI